MHDPREKEADRPRRRRGDGVPPVARPAADGPRLTTVAVAADVVVLDVRMPVVDGIGATRRITSAPPAPRVFVLTTFDLDEYALAAIRGRATAVLFKDAPPEDLLAAVRSAYHGDAVIAPSTSGSTRGSPGPNCGPDDRPEEAPGGHGPVQTVRVTCRGLSSRSVR